MSPKISNPKSQIPNRKSQIPNRKSQIPNPKSVEMAKHIIVTGRVQGVFFRKATQERAYELGITGWVRNTDDDSVEIFAQGEENDLNKFIEWCRHGPPRAQVEEIRIAEAENQNAANRFSIVY
jgi:acylphosphatase